MRIKIYLVVLGALFSCLRVGVAAADSEAEPPLFDASVYGAYNLVGSELTGAQFSGNGGGGGIAGKVFLPAHLFAETNYQYVRANGDQDGVGASASTNQIRAGLGLSFDVAGLPLPLAIFGKWNYVHYEYQVASDGQKGPRISDDGSDVDLGAALNFTHFKVSAGGGFLNIGSKRGPESIARLELPFGEHFYGFGEYRYDWIQNSDDTDKLRLIDYHVGVGLRF